uniref:Protein SRG1-like n=1 Tax=Rhizophora mucronata TaxID=61149 RepID=A0A2P2J1Y9_RHIMU
MAKPAGKPHRETGVEVSCPEEALALFFFVFFFSLK